MNRRADEVRKRIAMRKERQVRRLNQEVEIRDLPITYDDFPVMEKSSSIFDDDTGSPRHPLFKKEVFLMKIMISAILVIIVAILFRTNHVALDPSRVVVRGVFEQEFQFAAISQWYEEQFGTPLALWPNSPKKEQNIAQVDYVVPATGKIIETFQANGQGVLVETALHASVEAIDEGTVSFIGTKERLGKTVVIQHGDGSESWYGQLDSVAVRLYDKVDAKRTIGTVSTNEEKKAGNYYFAIKQENGFVDPDKVISFE
ncbi:M23 family metallopeptidase [Priestia taiwanensis]|uniref:Stage IV sporulation protein FA n=1 Tax=Priestia taiwanensis TaxID=1347902 RepID=A0A917ER48_9BACI|nr:M23 family metallopeptidase [Priestia taiwanensis]MBM7363610.1 stage IV sporulation protein FA [Priestia taiwanensis]GGE75651.1 stage IV sporulation protein FA [Priestia taiwanensis]